MRVIVIGGGASGIVSAIYASKNNDVTILEKNNTLGKKILITGNGKCNYYNDYHSIDCYNTQNKEILKEIVTEDNRKEILNLFDRIGIVPNIKNGYYYPHSNQAVSVQTALIKEAKNKGVNIITECEVISIDYKDEFIIKTKTEEYKADKVIVATGSKASPKTGTDGIGYKFAKHFNHTIIKPLPALTGLKAKGNYFKDWKGIRTDVKLTYKDKMEIGEIQLTDYGVSGVCVFNLSSIIARDLEQKSPILKINFVPFLNIETIDELITYFDKRDKLVENRSISELMDGFLNYKLVNLLLELSNIKKEYTWNNLDIYKKQKLMHNLLNFEVEIIGTNDFDKSQTCSGGIKLDEVNPNTMESLKQKGLYFTGELLDVDGKCGGYNLEFAFITGFLAGDNID